MWSIALWEIPLSLPTNQRHTTNSKRVRKRVRASLVWFGQEWFSLSHDQGFKELSAQRCPATTRLDQSKNIEKIKLRILPWVLCFACITGETQFSTRFCGDFVGRSQNCHSGRQISVWQPSVWLKNVYSTMVLKRMFITPQTIQMINSTKTY